MICEESFQSSGTHRQNSIISNKEYIQLVAFKFGALKNEVHSWFLSFGYKIYHYSEKLNPSSINSCAQIKDKV